MQWHCADHNRHMLWILRPSRLQLWFWNCHCYYMLSQINFHHSLFWGPLNLNVNLGSEVIHSLADQIEAELVLVGVDPDQLGAGEGGHVHWGLSVQPLRVYHQLQLGQAQGRELALSPKAIIVRSLKWALPLYRTASGLIAKRAKVKFLSRTGSPSCRIVGLLSLKFRIHHHTSVKALVSVKSLLVFPQLNAWDSRKALWHWIELVLK